MRPKVVLRKKRSIHVAIATIMLAVPASAYALTGPVSGPNAIPAAAARLASDVATAGSHDAAVATRIKVSRGPRDVLDGAPVVVGGMVIPAPPRRWVRLQGHFPTGWRTLDKRQTGAHGGFRLRFDPGSGVRRRLRVSLMGPVNRVVSTVPAGLVTAYMQSLASWYYDAGHTACGFHAGLGVANRDLPCGTRVRFRFGRHAVTATVDDRGPYVGGRDWDLNQATAAALGFAGVGTVWAAR